MSQAGSTSSSGGNTGAIFTINTITPDNTGNFTLTAGTGITLTPGTHAITIASSASGGIVTLTDGNGGNATGTTVEIQAAPHTGTLSFEASSSTVYLYPTLGTNTAWGTNSGFSLSSGIDNTSFGANSLYSCSTTDYNCCFGDSSGYYLTGTANTAYGTGSLHYLLGGSGNLSLGFFASQSYTGTESNNISIQSVAVTGDNNTIRIGDQGSGSYQINKIFLAGIFGSSPTSGNVPQVVVCDNAGQLTPLSSSTSGYILTSTGSGTPSFQANAALGGVTSINATAPLTANATSGSPETGAVTIALTTPITLALGGTNANLTASNGGIFYSTASAGAILAGTATAHQLLLSGASTTPVWSTSTYPTTNAANTILYASSSNTMAALATANNGVLITSAAGVPSWLANGVSAGLILTTNTGAPPSWQVQAAPLVTINTDSGGPLEGSTFTFTGGSTGLTFAGSGTTATLTGTLVLADGGTSASLTASNGGIFYSTASAGAILAGTATALQMLQSGASTTPAWSTSTWPNTTTISQLLYSSSANVVAGITTADNGVLITSNSGVPSWLANSGTAGYVLTANSGAPASWQAVSSSGAVVTLDGNTGSATPSSGVITITTAASLVNGTATFVASGHTVTLSPYNTTLSVISNTAWGYMCGQSLSSGTNNSCYGTQSLKSCVTGGSNVAIGANALALSTASTSTAVGVSALSQVLTGVKNLALGNLAGFNYTSSESSNIVLSNEGVISESNTIRIGTQGSSAGQQNICYIAGITGATPTSGNVPQVVVCDNLGNLTPLSSSTSGYVLTSNGSATPSFQAASGSSNLTLTTVNHAASPYTVLSTDQVLLVDVSGGAVTIKLPNTTTTGRPIYIKDSTGGSATNNISITTVGGTVTIDGQTTYVINVNYLSLEVVFDSANYQVL